MSDNILLRYAPRRTSMYTTTSSQLKCKSLDIPREYILYGEFCTCNNRTWLGRCLSSWALRPSSVATWVWGAWSRYRVVDRKEGRITVQIWLHKVNQRRDMIGDRREQRRTGLRTSIYNHYILDHKDAWTVLDPRPSPRRKTPRNPGL
jgi:hypothetical protein